MHQPTGAMAISMVPAGPLSLAERMMFTGKPILNFIIGLLAVIGLLTVLGTAAMWAMHTGMMHGVLSCGDAMYQRPGT
ncbi:hypothetical protein [Burkholderia ubonensis]|nr:hypothetical protein [Burkholderia ubonensis]